MNFKQLILDKKFLMLSVKFLSHSLNSLYKWFSKYQVGRGQCQKIIYTLISPISITSSQIPTYGNILGGDLFIAY